MPISNMDGLRAAQYPHVVFRPTGSRRGIYISGLLWLRRSDRAAFHMVAEAMNWVGPPKAPGGPGWSMNGDNLYYRAPGASDAYHSTLMIRNAAATERFSLHWDVRLWIEGREVWLSRAGRLALRRMAAEKAAALTARCL